MCIALLLLQPPELTCLSNLCGFTGIVYHAFYLVIWVFVICWLMMITTMMTLAMAAGFRFSWRICILMRFDNLLVTLDMSIPSVEWFLIFDGGEELSSEGAPHSHNNEAHQSHNWWILTFLTSGSSSCCLWILNDTTTGLLSTVPHQE